MTAGGHNDGWRGRWPGRVLRFPVTRIVLGYLAITVVNLPFSGKFVVRLSPTIHRRASTLASLARVKDQSLNTVVVEALEEYLSAQGV